MLTTSTSANRRVLLTNEVDPDNLLSKSSAFHDASHISSISKKKKKKKSGLTQPLPPATVIDGVTIHTTDEVTAPFTPPSLSTSLNNDSINKTKKKKRKKGKAKGAPNDSAGSTTSTHEHRKHMVHYGSSGDHKSTWYEDEDERERIREFWLSLSQEERMALVKIEKETVLKKMKEHQRQTCSCSVCGRKRVVIEEELELLYDAYYEELEHIASEQHDIVSRGYFPSSHFDHVDQDDVDDIEDDFEDGYESDESGFMEFGGSLRVRGIDQQNEPCGILTVAEDFLKNDGRKFLDLMEHLARRKFQGIADEYDYSQPPQSFGEGDYGMDEDDYDDYDDDDENMDDHYSEQQRLEDGRRMFQIFAAKMFEQRVLAAYRDRIAQEKQQKFLEELEAEEREKERKDRLKQENKEKKRLLKKLQKEEALKQQREQEEREAEAKRKREEEEAEKQRKRQEQIRLMQKAAEEEKRRKAEDERLKEQERKKKDAENSVRKQKEKDKKGSKSGKQNVQSDPSEQQQTHSSKHSSSNTTIQTRSPLLETAVIAEMIKSENSKKSKELPMPSNTTGRFSGAHSDRLQLPDHQLLSTVGNMESRSRSTSTVGTNSPGVLSTSEVTTSPPSSVSEILMANTPSVMMKEWALATPSIATSSQELNHTIPKFLNSTSIPVTFESSDTIKSSRHGFAVDATHFPSPAAAKDAWLSGPPPGIDHTIRDPHMQLSGAPGFLPPAKPQVPSSSALPGISSSVDLFGTSNWNPRPFRSSSSLESSLFNSDPLMMAVDAPALQQTRFAATSLLGSSNVSPWSQHAGFQRSTMPTPPGLNAFGTTRPVSSPVERSYRPQQSQHFDTSFWANNQSNQHMHQSAYSMLPPHLLDELDLDRKSDPLIEFSCLDLNDAPGVSSSSDFVARASWTPPRQ